MVGVAQGRTRGKHRSASRGGNSVKRGTPRHPKTYLLAETLGVRLPEAVGILEMLWQHTAQHTPCGDIGSLPDRAIAAAVEWHRRPEVLIDALVSCGWLERSELYRIFVHDWPQHCEQSVKKWIDYNGKNFLRVYEDSPEKVSIEGGESLPSRVAMAKAGASVKNRKKEKPEVYLGQRDDFEEFWIPVWRKVAKSAAWEAFRKHVISHEIHARVMAAVTIQRVVFLARDIESQPHPATWLNGERWTDDPAAYSTNGSRRQETAIERAIREA